MTDIACILLSCDRDLCLVELVGLFDSLKRDGETFSYVVQTLGREQLSVRYCTIYVLHKSSCNSSIPGSVATVSSLHEAGIPAFLCVTLGFSQANACSESTLGSSNVSMLGFLLE